MATQTLAPTWSPTSCPASTDVWEIYLTTSAVFFVLGPLTATSDCAPSGYTPTVPYYAASCPTGYTSACAHGLNDMTTVCCPTARPMSCAASPKLYDSLTLSCEEKFSSSYTAVVTTTSPFVDSGNTGTATVVFTPHFDAVNGFGLEYVPMTSTSSSSAPANTGVTTTAARTSPSSSPTSTPVHDTSGNGLSGGAIAGIVVAAIAFVFILVMVWNRAKITAWVHRKTAPGSSGMEQSPNYTPSHSGPGLYPGGYSTTGIGSPRELESTRRPAELPATRQIVEKDGSNSWGRET